MDPKSIAEFEQNKNKLRNMYLLEEQGWEQGPGKADRLEWEGRAKPQQVWQVPRDASKQGAWHDTQGRREAAYW
jgi:hypothetical protein